MYYVYIENMNEKETKYISRILSFLEKGSEWSCEEMIEWLDQHEDHYSLEEDAHHYQYCLISYPLEGIDCISNTPEKIVLLVFENDTVIADIAAVWASVEEIQDDQITNISIAEMDAWTESNLYVIQNAFLHNPSLYHSNDIGCIICNAYVTEAYRRQGIFTAMLQMVRDQAVRYSQDHVTVFQSISLDPDIACYGPDAKEEPYYYSIQQDDPKRMLNAQIMQHLGFVPVQLEHSEEDSLSDGTFIWYAIKAEHLTIVHNNESNSLS